MEDHYTNEPDLDEHFFGSIALSEMFEVDDELIIQIAKDKKLSCKWWMNIPFFSTKEINKLAKILNKPVPVL